MKRRVRQSLVLTVMVAVIFVASAGLAFAAPQQVTNDHTTVDEMLAMFNIEWDNPAVDPDMIIVGIGVDAVPGSPPNMGEPPSWPGSVYFLPGSTTSWMEFLEEGLHTYNIAIWTQDGTGISAPVRTSLTTVILAPPGELSVNPVPVITPSGGRRQVNWNNYAIGSTEVAVAMWEGLAAAPATPPLDFSFPCQITQLSGAPTTTLWAPPALGRTYTVAVWSGLSGHWSRPTTTVTTIATPTPEAAQQLNAVQGAGAGGYDLSWINFDPNWGATYGNLATEQYLGLSATRPAAGSLPLQGASVLPAAANTKSITLQPGVWFVTIWRGNSTGISDPCTVEVNVPGPPVQPAMVYIATSTSLKAPKSVRVRRTLKVTGNSAAGRVVIYKYRKVGRRWRSMGSATVTSNGAYAYSFKPRYRGQWRFRAQYLGAQSGSAIYNPSWSVYRSTKVK